ncbi:hypothetical protein BN977_04449 [Mycolicibacterium cosmeticum]|uniref:Uncharacterized protein n=1 Tax=Mycolicibacterium cosmeticum TaxID=258533 RepID=W9BLG8_MYCCO|nr:hypothetical protein BN977_04449 [Mycolicibacterium cosmeticum]
MKTCAGPDGHCHDDRALRCTSGHARNATNGSVRATGPKVSIAHGFQIRLFGSLRSRCTTAQSARGRTGPSDRGGISLACEVVTTASVTCAGFALSNRSIDREGVKSGDYLLWCCLWVVTSDDIDRMPRSRSYLGRARRPAPGGDRLSEEFSEDRLRGRRMRGHISDDTKRWLRANDARVPICRSTHLDARFRLEALRKQVRRDPAQDRGSGVRGNLQWQKRAALTN